MLKYYIKHALRVIYRDKFHSLLNIVGLSIGIACGVIVLLYVQSELTYDKHHEKHDRIYRYGVNMTIGGVNSSQTTCNAAVGPLLKDHMSGIESYMRIGKPGEMMIKYTDKAYFEENIHWVDSSFFNLFTHRFIEGDPVTCLKNINSMVITEELAYKIFGDKDPINEILEIENQGLFTITAVIEDPLENSSLDFDGLLSFSTLYHDQDLAEVYNPRRLGGNMFFGLYFLFKEGFTTELFYDQFQTFYDQNFAEIDRIEYRAVVEPLLGIHLNSELTIRQSNVFKRLLFGLSSIGIFILILACINYINLATSRAGGRTKEIGIKKVTGAGKRQLIQQFLGESFILSLISLILGLGMAEVIFIFTPLNDVFNKDLQIDIFHNPVLAFGAIGLTVFVAFVSGLYPSFYLSRILPVKVLRKNVKENLLKVNLRNILVVFQFAISIGSVALTLLMNQQLKYIRSKDLGFDSEQVVLITVRDEKIREKMAAYQKVINSYHGVLSSSFSSTTPGYGISGMAFLWESKTGEMERHAYRELYADPDYFETLGIEFVSGSNFLHKRTENDSVIDFIVNEAMVTRMGWEEPVGKRNQYGQVIGVVKDFHFGTLHTEILPLYILQPRNTPTFLNIKIKGENLDGTIDFLEARWKELFPDYPVIYHFLDQRFDFLYEQDHLQKRLTDIFAWICIIISCLGLLGLTSFNTLQRTKEIAVRKVHGAGIINVIIILFRNVFYLLLIASLLAIPFGYWVYKLWIKNFAYQADINPMIFGLAGIIAIIIAFFASSYHTLKAALVSPVISLRYE